MVDINEYFRTFKTGKKRTVAYKVVNSDPTRYVSADVDEAIIPIGDLIDKLIDYKLNQKKYFNKNKIENDYSIKKIKDELNKMSITTHL